MAAVVLNKVRTGGAHLRSQHARVGAAACAVWLAALIVAESEVWREGLPRPGNYKPRFLWSNKLHRQLGVVVHTHDHAAPSFIKSLEFLTRTARV